MAVNRAYHSPVARKTHSVGRLGGGVLSIGSCLQGHIRYMGLVSIYLHEWLMFIYGKCR